jgi:hypothetical protein
MPRVTILILPIQAARATIRLTVASHSPSAVQGTKRSLNEIARGTADE